jgi:hypothetical protein
MNGGIHEGAHASRTTTPEKQNERVRLILSQATAEGRGAIIRPLCPLGCPQSSRFATSFHNRPGISMNVGSLNYVWGLRSLLELA